MWMLFMIALAFLSALVIGGEEEKTAAAANFQAVCDFNAGEIEKLEKNKKDLEDLVKLESVLYEKLNSSSGICNAIAYLALPECAIKKEGSKKEGVNVFDKLDDKCAEEKTNKITKSLKKLLGLDTEPSGQVVFRSCKDIFVKIILEQFKKIQGLIYSQCEQSTSIGPARRKRSYGGGYYPGGHDPSTIWFQYLLCHEQKISCYFFTQGWNEKEYGQYYLYENLLDTGFDKLGHASSGTDDLLILALLGGLGGSHKYPHQGYPSYKKRRDVEDEEAATEDPEKSVSRIRSNAATEDPTTKAPGMSGRRRRSNDEDSTTKEPEKSGRRRRSNSATEDSTTKDPKEMSGRRRRSIEDSTMKECEEWPCRRRRSNSATEYSTTKDPKEKSGRRRRSNEDSATKDSTKDPQEKSGRRRRRNAATEDSTNKDPEEKSRRRRRSNAATEDLKVVLCESIDKSDAC